MTGLRNQLKETVLTKSRISEAVEEQLSKLEQSQKRKIQGDRITWRRPEDGGWAERRSHPMWISASEIEQIIQANHHQVEDYNCFVKVYL